MDTESYYGNMLIAFGANFTYKLGGKNRANFHFDIPTRNHSDSGGRHPDHRPGTIRGSQRFELD